MRDTIETTLPLKQALSVLIGRHGLRSVVVALSLHCDDCAAARRALQLDGAEEAKVLSGKLLALAGKLNEKGNA